MKQGAQSHLNTVSLSVLRSSTWRFISIQSPFRFCAVGTGSRCGMKAIDDSLAPLATRRCLGCLLQLFKVARQHVGHFLITAGPIPRHELCHTVGTQPHHGGRPGSQILCIVYTSVRLQFRAESLRSVLDKFGVALNIGCNLVLGSMERLLRRKGVVVGTAASTFIGSSSGTAGSCLCFFY